MTLTKEKYMPRLIDKKIERYLRVFGAICIEGPKWCGKTWTSLNHANSVSYMTDKSEKDNALVDPRYIFKKERSQLIDEWQVVPSIWDEVRHECDQDHDKGKFILTRSTTLNNDSKDDVYHSGTGRITVLSMNTMSLYESQDSTGDVSIQDMINGTVKEGYIRSVELDELAYYIVRGGWPENLFVDKEDIGLIPKSYIESIIKKDMYENQTKNRDQNKMRMLLRSLSRNETSLAGHATLVKDIEEFENEAELIESRKTIADYLSVLDSLYLTANQNAYNLNYRSSKRVGKSPKRHLTDPSLCCASLNLTVDKLLKDHETFGLLFESLVERDLRIYADHLNGQLYHFRDNSSKDEVDAIIEFEDGQYAAFEVKLSDNRINEAIKSLSKFYKHVHRKPLFMCVVVGHLSTIRRDKDTGIYIVPITSLRP